MQASPSQTTSLSTHLQYLQCRQWKQHQVDGTLLAQHPSLARSGTVKQPTTCQLNRMKSGHIRSPCRNRAAQASSEISPLAPVIAWRSSMPSTMSFPESISRGPPSLDAHDFARVNLIREATAFRLMIYCMTSQTPSLATSTRDGP